jgi:hypothetical protein|tara:strand:- start:3552 stop:3665 length:114 start_codon:yes stop_codon:yes gene_type:complete
MGFKKSKSVGNMGFNKMGSKKGLDKRPKQASNIAKKM